MRRLATVLAVALVLAGCSSGDTTSSPTTTVVTATTSTTTAAPTTTVDHYTAYVALAGQLGGDVIGRSDAATRAALECGDGGPEMLRSMGVTALADFPTDLALVRAYCPEREAALP